MSIQKSVFHYSRSFLKFILNFTGKVHKIIGRFQKNPYPFRCRRMEQAAKLQNPEGNQRHGDQESESN